MTTKERIKFLVEQAGRYVASHFCLTDPDDVGQEHVDFAYKILWTNDKLGVELHTDASQVKEAIQSAVEDFNVAYSCGFTPYYEEDAA
jgi:glutathione peroxidase-family protein